MSTAVRAIELPPPSLSQNGNGLPREEEVARARRQIRAWASTGMSLGEILRRVEGSYNDTERDLIWLIASHEVDRASRSSATRR